MFIDIGNWCKLFTSHVRQTVTTHHTAPGCLTQFNAYVGHPVCELASQINKLGNDYVI